MLSSRFDTVKFEAPVKAVSYTMQLACYQSIFLEIQQMKMIAIFTRNIYMYVYMSGSGDVKSQCTLKMHTD